MNVLLFFAGLAALVAGADLLVRGASKIALSFGVSPLVVGLTIVAFGTSAPELAVSVGAALDGKADIAVGNVVGSNTFNVLFILGVSALITPLIVNVQLIRQEVPIMIAASVLLIALTLFDGVLSRLDGAVLFMLLIVYVVFLIVQSRRQTLASRSEFAEEMPPADSRWDRHWSVQGLLVVAGLVLLVLGSGWLIDTAIVFAKMLGVSDVVIGLTVVAAGTSLPEVATSVTAAIKGERDIAVGNVVGSNTFNILGCLGLASIAAPGGVPVAASMLHMDVWVMLAAAVACLPVFMRAREISRWEGAVFLLYYVAYAMYLILVAQRHAALPLFSQTMIWFVIPLTVLTMLLMFVRTRRNVVSHRPRQS